MNEPNVPKEIIQPVYYAIFPGGYVRIDEEEIRNEFEMKLSELINQYDESDKIDWDKE